MAGIDDIFKMTQWQKSLQKTLRHGTQLSDLIKAQADITINQGGFSFAAEFAKAINKHHKMYEFPSNSAIKTKLNGMYFQTKITVPKTTIEAIVSLNGQYEQLYKGLIGVAEAHKFQSPTLAQINSLNFALRNFSGHIASIAAKQRNWEIINDFEEVSEQAIEFSESLTDQITEEQQRQFQILLTLVSAFVKKYGVQGLLIIDIILRFAGFHQYYDFLQKKPELPTKQEVNQISIKQDSIIQFISIVNEQLIQAKEYRITNRVCEAKLKPKTKTLTVSKLPKDFELVVLQIHHKWVLVSYFDPNDNLPQTGWIMKKHLDKPE